MNKDPYLNIPINEIPKRIIDDWFENNFNNEISYELVIDTKRSIRDEFSNYGDNHNLNYTDPFYDNFNLQVNNKYILNILEKKINNLEFKKFNELFINNNKKHKCLYHKYFCDMYHVEIIEMIKNIYDEKYTNFLIINLSELKEQVNELKTEINKIKTEIEFRPDGKGYNKAKLRFENKDY